MTLAKRALNILAQILFVAVLGTLSPKLSAVEPDAVPDGESYPAPQCTRPQIDLVWPESGNQAAVANFNVKVREFNRGAAAYDSCIHDYIDKANRDIQRIQDKANTDVKEITTRANASIKAIQDKARQAAADANAIAASLKDQAEKLRKH